jgi:5-methylcytosine-specific restriction endonuclease McrA
MTNTDWIGAVFGYGLIALYIFGIVYVIIMVEKYNRDRKRKKRQEEKEVADLIQAAKLKGNRLAKWQAGLLVDEGMTDSYLHDLDQKASVSDRRKAIPERVKMYVWRRDQGKCVKCGSRTNLEYDHIIPVSKGGGNTERNIELLCEECNRKKGARLTS